MFKKRTKKLGKRKHHFIVIKKQKNDIIMGISQTISLLPLSLHFLRRQVYIYVYIYKIYIM